MALLNENRNRVPLITTAPATNVNGGIRGQMRLIETGGNATLYVCLTTGDDEVRAEMVTPDKRLRYRAAVGTGATGNSTTVTTTVAANSTLGVSVTGSAVTVTLDGDANGDPLSTILDVITLVNNDASASALVEAEAVSSEFEAYGAVAFPTQSLAGGVDGTAVWGTVTVTPI